MVRKRAAADQTGFLLQRAHRRLRQAHNEALRPLEMNIAHLAVVALLAEHGDLSQRQLIEIMGVDKSTMVYVIDELEGQGLVERRPDPADRRAYAVHLTEPGRARMIEAGAVVARVEDDFLSPLTAAERLRFDGLLRRLAAGTPRHPPPAPGATARTARAAAATASRSPRRRS
jgi:MarR family transcriptional regulator, lower aerobic nicotinate degradation pathway regulator